MSARRMRGLALALGVAVAIAVAGALLLQRPEEAATGTGDATGTDALEAFLAEAGGDGFEPLAGAWTLSLPADFGAHDAARAETWTITAHLRGLDGARVGLSFALSRYGLIGPDDPARDAPWTLATLHTAQIALSGEGAIASASEERFGRGDGIAGHDPASRQVWLDDWTLAYGTGAGGQGLTLAATVEGVPVRLSLAPSKEAVVAQGAQEAPTRGFVMPRMDVSGTIGVGADAAEVTGTAWIDRLWGDLPVPGGPIAYDRLVMQLPDGVDISAVRTRRVGSDGAGTVDGLIVEASGATRAFDGAAATLEIIERREVEGGAAYPVGWRLTGAGFDLRAVASGGGQGRDFLSPVWLGPVRVEGTYDGAPVDGAGTLLLTGYEAR
ncbi:lipocalin-like domain-containing protein [Roseibacterium sp. SDUM158017]|uniref:lipocalin-like domain-containing protein n=1 Tax=Roseicyclus salinarum TaxID=3036773 RepID=UPI002414D6A2|nr:lipocalin-like domain-containing protein [Roseibacterium sp. SDUM158017]MDG4648133.1 lipocalin-like domain-containing protein [Roseibacterium sp. SDUM158017]